MKLFFFLFIVIHSLIHLLVFFKAFRLAKIPQLIQTITKPAGVLWLLAAVLLSVTGLMFFFGNQSWWMVGAPAVMLSQTLIFIYWSDAKFGTVANLIILLPLVVAIADALPKSYRNIYRTEVKKGIERLSPTPMVTEEDVRHLPPPIQRYLRYTGAIGNPRIQNFRARFTGQIRRTTESGWMDFSSQQYNFFDDPTRVFFIESTMFGLPFDGLHLYAGRSATMQIKVASLFQIVDAKGDTMTQGETVTLFNDMCVMAPASLIEKSIHWESVDSLTAKGIFTNKGITVSALLSFNERGELVDFSSDDRFMSADGITYQNYRWTTPMKNYKEFAGRRLATQAELIWHTPEGEFVYGRFELADIEYNCTKFD
jgi:hypothetical protein